MSVASAEAVEDGGELGSLTEEEELRPPVFPGLERSGTAESVVDKGTTRVPAKGRTPLDLEGAGVAFDEPFEEVGDSGLDFGAPRNFVPSLTTSEELAAKRFDARLTSFFLYSRESRRYQGLLRDTLSRPPQETSRPRSAQSPSREGTQSTQHLGRGATERTGGVGAQRDRVLARPEDARQRRLVCQAQDDRTWRVWGREFGQGEGDGRVSCDGVIGGVVG